MKIISSIIMVILFVAFQPNLVLAQGASKSGAKSKKKKPSLSWKKYHAACGTKNGSREKNFKKLRGKDVLWVGQVAEIVKDLALGDHRRWNKKVVRVKMKPSDALIADIRLRAPKKNAKKISALKKGDIIAFKGKIMYLGSRLSDHVVEVSNFKKMAKKKKRSRKN